MLVRYRMNSSCTIANMQSDIDKIILGISSVNELSSGCDKTNSVIYGTYPTGKYARVNQTSYTYSKAHNDSTTSKTHYFRLTYSGTQLTTVTLARSYTAGTDTLVDSYINNPMTSLNISPFTYNSAAPIGLDIIINAASLIFLSGTAVYKGLVDIGHSSTTRAYTDSMLMVWQDFMQVPIYSTTSGTIYPYLWNFTTGAYGTLEKGLTGVKSTKVISSTGSQLLFENPILINNNVANTSNSLYNVFQIPASTFAGLALYKDSNNLWRVTINDVSILVD